MEKDKMNKNYTEKKVYLVEYSDRNDSEIVFASNIKDLISRIKGRKWDNFMDITEEYENSK